ncbi:MAG: hypothetical protein GY710_09105 [Desulfobacteraceae bacterium]|nr:hypothetical protein [Desulfobacteraceae bacterium]
MKKVFFKGGSSSEATYDAAYNARMAAIAESQQGMADEYFDFWQNNYKPMEEAQINANMEMIPLETGLAKEKIQAESDLLPGQVALEKASNESNLALLPGQTDLAKAQITDSLTAIGEKTPVRNAFFKESLQGVDVEGRANKAGADAAQAFAGSHAIMSRDAAKMGVNPNSGKFASMTNTNALNRAKTISGARTQARTGAEQENYGRLTNAMGY